MILNLIRALYQPDILLSDNPVFFEQVWEDIDFFSISPQIFSLLSQSGRLESTPLFFQNRLKRASKKALYQNIFIRSQQQQIFDRFEELKILVIPLKGVIFSEKYFGSLGARVTSDIDLLVHPSDLPKAIQCVKSLGFNRQSEPPHFHVSMSKDYPGLKLPLTIDLHWNVLDDRTSSLQIEDFWKHAKPIHSYSYVKELSDYHTFYMICLHGWRHHLNSLKYILDILQLIHVLKDQMDYSVLWEDARSHNNFRRIYKTLAIVYNLFPHLNDQLHLPKSKLLRSLWEYNAIRNVNHKTYKQYLNLLQFKYFDFDSLIHSLAAFINWLRPSPTDLYFELGNMKHVHPYLQLYRHRSIRLLRKIFLK